MKNLFAILFVLGLTLVSAQELSHVRKAYKSATTSEAEAKSFAKSLNSVTSSSSAVLRAYKGASMVLDARYLAITKRMKPIKKGIEWIESAVKSDPKSVEIRLVRLSIQENTPKIVGYKDNIDEDKAFINANLSKVKDDEIDKMAKEIVK